MPTSMSGPSESSPLRQPGNKEVYFPYLQLMLIGSTPEQLNSWKKEMHQYQKSKRTKKPFGSQIPPVDRVTEKDVKVQQTKFNPILQTFKNPQELTQALQKESDRRAKCLADQQKQQAKYQKEYDIINLHSHHDDLPPPPKEKFNQVPLRTNYNIVSNEALPEYFFKNRSVNIAKIPEKKVFPDAERGYDIISNVYNEDDEIKKEEEWRQFERKEEEKYWKARDYNLVNGAYYDLNKEEDYQEELEKEMKDHGKTQKDKLPPSYVKRVPWVMDPTKEIPQEAKAVEERQKNAKKRYDTRYVVQKQYQDRNFEDYLKKESVVKNKVHDLRIHEAITKQFDIITLNDYNKEAKEALYNKKNTKPDTVTFGKKHP